MFGRKKVNYSISKAPCGAYLREGACGAGPVLKKFSSGDDARAYVRDVINPGLVAKGKTANIHWLY